MRGGTSGEVCTQRGGYSTTQGLCRYRPGRFGIHIAACTSNEGGRRSLLFLSTTAFTTARVVQWPANLNRRMSPAIFIDRWHRDLSCFQEANITNGNAFTKLGSDPVRIHGYNDQFDIKVEHVSREEFVSGGSIRTIITAQALTVSRTYRLVKGGPGWTNVTCLPSTIPILQ